MLKHNLYPPFGADRGAHRTMTRAECSDVLRLRDVAPYSLRSPHTAALAAAGQQSYERQAICACLFAHIYLLPLARESELN